MDNTKTVDRTGDVGGAVTLRKYNIVNNSLGWLCFLIAAVTYLLTVEPTASFWDCPEFIAQGAKLEVGHPPGNPIFMLTARFFVTIFGGSMEKAALAVNCMSALLSAATILLLFWTVTHLVRRIIIRDNAQAISLPRMMVIMGAGVCGALVYAWSDTFWFSAVEGEVYAFSSFCTALVFWLILKWENRADSPMSDRYLILIAYIIGVSIAVHLLNLLCIPAIVLVIYYRKFKNPNVKGSLVALAVSFVIVAAILYGLVPGFIKVAQMMELIFVNGLGMSYNTGVLFYAVLFLGVIITTIFCLYKHVRPWVIRVMVALSVMLSGMPFMTDHKILWLILVAGLSVYLFGFCHRVPYRIFNIVMISIMVIFVGYSSYALLLVRASSNPPMNQNAPDNVFTLASYLNREQYGDNPLFYGQTFAEGVKVYDISDDGEAPYYVVQVDETGTPVTSIEDGLMRDYNYGVIDDGEYIYTRGVKTSENDPDVYVRKVWKPKLRNNPEFNMLLPRMYSNSAENVKNYKSWALIENPDLSEWSARVPEEKRAEWAGQGMMPLSEFTFYAPDARPVDIYFDENGEPIRDRMHNTSYVWTPGQFDNLKYFFNYQLVHMYWRYFMWNFAGRQNDIQGNGEPHLGNWISGIPMIDDMRLGDQSLLPEEYTTGNKGHNVYYMLPLLLGILGLVWQSLMKHPANPDRGIQQFWVVFFLFFMTGIAIVLYLNQPPGQPRERDYAFAGSFYAFAIWVGMGVPAIWSIARSLMGVKKESSPAPAAETTPVAAASRRKSYIAAGIGCLFGVLVPLQMVSQTWDDHDRSHRYTTRDFGENYLNSLDENAIIFTNGDNDTFPLWYAQEVEGVRTDVRVVNLSYLTTDWYANQLQYPYYDAKPVKMLARPQDYAYDKLQVVYYDQYGPTCEAIKGLTDFYADPLSEEGRYSRRVPELRTPNMYMVVDHDKAVSAFGINPNSSDSITKLPYLTDMMSLGGLNSGGAFLLNSLLSYDIMANSINDGFERPVYFASTVPGNYYLGMRDYMGNTGMAYQITPFYNAPASPMAEKAYENIVSKFKWGGLDDPNHNSGLYLDETVRRMVSTVRSSMATTATDLIYTDFYEVPDSLELQKREFGELPATEFAREWAAAHGKPVPANRYDMARYLLNLMEEKLPAEVAPYDGMEVYIIPTYLKLYRATGNTDDLRRARNLIDKSLVKNAKFLEYAISLGPNNFSTLSHDAAYTRINLPILLALANYADLLETAYAEPDAASRAALLDEIDNAIDAETISSLYVNVNPAVFMEGRGEEDVYTMLNAARNQRDQQECQVMYLLLDINQRFGIDPMKRANDLFKGRRARPSDIKRLDRFIYQ